MSKGSNSSTTDSSTTSSVAPNPAALQAYQDLLTRSQGVSQTPYSAYGGQEVAPINQTQQGGIGDITSLSDSFQPYGQQAGANIAEGTAPVDEADIAKYYDPYQRQVIDATQADFNTQNQRANSITTGNAAAQGALGGNRVGVAQALTQEGQARVQAPVIAGLQSAGFQNAVTNANAQKNRQIQGGQAELQGGEQAAGAQVGAGTLQQQTTQAQDTQARADYFQQQGYPFATAQWLASIALPTGAQMGSTTTGSGTSTTQGPQPNQWMQGAGLALSAASIFSDRRLKENIHEVGKLHDGQKIYRYNFKGDNKTQIGLIADEVAKKHPDAVGESGGFGTVDYDAATDDAVKRFDGGRIAGFASGGMPGADLSGGFGWVPSAQVQGTPLQAQQMKAPEHAKLPEQKTDFAGMGKQLGTIGKGLYDKYNAVGDPLSDYSPEQDTSNANYGVGPEQSAFYGGGDSLFSARGGRIGFADGGVPVSAGFGGGSYDDDLSPNDAVEARFANPMLGSDQYKNFGAHSAALKEAGLRGHDDTAVAEDTPLTAKPVQTTSFMRPPETATADATPQGDIVPSALRAFKSIKSGAPPKSALGFAQQDDASDDAPTDISSAGRRPPAGVPPGVAAAPKSGMGGWNPLGISDEARQGLISMGLGMMANRTGGKGSFLAGVGEAGNAGMTTYASAKAATAAAAAKARHEAFEREKFERPYNEMTADQKARREEGRYSIIPGVTAADGSPIERDTHHPGKPPINAITRKPLTPDEMSGVKTGGWKPYSDKVTAEGDPVLINPQGQTKNAVTGQQLGPDTKLVSAKEVMLSGVSAASRGYQLALGDVKGAYAGLPFGSGGNRAKTQVREQALSSLMSDGGMTEKEAGEYLSAQSQSFTSTGIGLSAEARTAGVREANLKIILKAADAAVPAALEASEKVGRSGYRALNSIIQKGQVMTSDPNLKEFGMANLQLAEHWARAMNPTGVMRESDRDMALSYLNTADSKETYARAVAQLQKQINRELAAVHSVKTAGGFGAKVSDHDSTADEARKELRVAGGSAPAATAPATLKPEDQQALDWANANPKDPRAAAIKKRLGV